MRVLLKTLRGVGLVAVVAMSLLGVAVSGAIAASPPADPFVLQAGLSGPEVGNFESKNAGGESVALSADGNTALIGGVNAQWVFTRSGSIWTMQAELNSGVGSSVALSGDGNTALIGEPGDNEGVGAVWVFTRSDSTWTQVGPKLTGGDETGQGRFGSSVALASDGNTALIGGPGDNEGVGAVWVFTRSGSIWTMQAKLTGNGETGEGQFGHTVVLAADSKTALVGGPRDNGGRGAAWTFMRSGKAWNQQDEKLTGAGEVGEGGFGSGVAISSHGKTALIGGGNDNAAQTEAPKPVGAAWVFARSGKTWTQPGEKLTGGPQYGEAYCGGFGSSVALSYDGDTALIGDPGAPFACFGTASFLTRSGKGWTREQVGAEGPHPGEFGRSVALSSDGNTGLIGEPGAFHFWGEAFVFVQ
jgi:hypothetical protein